MKRALLIIVLLLLFIFIGFQIQPKPFPFPNLAQQETQTVPLPENLPQSVQRLAQVTYGESIPLIDTIVMTGTAKLNPFGIWLPARYLILHKAGKDYRHYFEVTFYGFPILKINEGYVDGESFFESPMGNTRNDPNTNQGANLTLWAEAAWFPAILLTDPAIRWQEVDDRTALLFVPYQDQTDNLLVRFSETGTIDFMQAMRYRTPDSAEKSLWLIHRDLAHPGTDLVSWFETGKPWAAFKIGEMRVNLEIDSLLRQRGIGE